MSNNEHIFFQGSGWLELATILRAASMMAGVMYLIVFYLFLWPKVLHLYTPAKLVWFTNAFLAIGTLVVEGFLLALHVPFNYTTFLQPIIGVTLVGNALAIVYYDRFVLSRTDTVENNLSNRGEGIGPDGLPMRNQK